MKPEQLRARVLAEWRGLPETPFSRDTAKLITEPLAKLMTALGLDDRMREGAVLQAWEETVGEFVARHSSPQRLSLGVLYVHVLQPTLRYELETVWKKEILAKLKARFGAKVIREVRFRLG